MCKVEVTWGREIWGREETDEEMDMEVTEGVDEQRVVGMDVGLIDYKIRTIITKRGRGMNTCSGREAMLRELLPMTENILVDSGREGWKATERRENRWEG